MKISTSSKDDFLYERIIILLQQVKLVRGGTELAYTLRNHKKIRDYCKEKQSTELKYIEDHYFNVDGTLIGAVTSNKAVSPIIPFRKSHQVWSYQLS